MPPTSAHFNGSVNLEDTDQVFAALGSTLGELVHAYPDGETSEEHSSVDIEPGNRRYWIWFQVPVLAEASGIIRIEDGEFLGDRFPKFAVDPEADEIAFGRLGYADEYAASYRRFQDAKEEGTVPAEALFQVQYPTAHAVCSVFVDPTSFEAVHAAYQEALLADLQDLLGRVGDDVVVQWDVCTEFGPLEGWFGPDAALPVEAVADQLATYIDVVPAHLQVGVHLCYGDYRHQHLSQPEDLGTQVELLNALDARILRFLDFASITVPQDRDDDAYFEPLSRLVIGGQLFFGIIPYHPANQKPGTISAQVEAIDQFLGGDNWGVCTECGLGRVDPDDVQELIDLHRTVILRYATSPSEV